MKPASAKNKGRLLQQWVRDRLLSRLKGVEPDDIKSTPMGVNGPDVMLSPAARRKWPWTVECKSRAAFSVYSIMDQAESSMPPNTRPVVILKGNRKKPLALVYAEHFLDITCQK
jgi:hypothetical protein|tara:strand:+ start:762 stop:1103 length:342 start_codon:yes stop_codon:yes gene_type:complete